MVLCFGLIRPYKGVDVLLDAWRRAERPDGAELWIVGMPRMDAGFIARPGVRTALRFVSGAELAGAFRAADLVVLPYREIDQSGVLFTALAFGKPMLLSAVGGFPEIAATGAAELVPPGDADALAAALTALLGDEPRGVTDGRRRAGRRRRPVQLGRDRRADARALLGAPGVDVVVRRAGLRGARRRPALAGAEEARPLRDPLRRQVVLVDEQLDQLGAELLGRPVAQQRHRARRHAAPARRRRDPVADLAVARSRSISITLNEPTSSSPSKPRNAAVSASLR